MQISSIIITYNRIEDAKIQMELIRNLWTQEPLLKNVTIYHIYNGNPEWYTEKYIEDSLITRKNPGHLLGAADLINTGIQNAVKNTKENSHYIIITSADTWIIQPTKLANIINAMQNKAYLVATSHWFLQKALATEFFVIKASFAHKVFPLDIEKYKKQNKIPPGAEKSVVELTFAKKITTALNCTFGDAIWNKNVYLIPERRWIHYFKNRYHTKKLGYISSHNINKKRKFLIQKDLAKYGASIRKFINTKTTSTQG